MEMIAKALDIHQPWLDVCKKKNKNGGKKNTMTKEQFEKLVRDTIDNHGHLPSYSWLTDNEAPLINYMRNNKITLADVRSQFFEKGIGRMRSMDGTCWRSSAEAGLCNFLISRGVEYIKGKKYPETYANFGDRKIGWYDLHFSGSKHPFINIKIDVEVNGEKPMGHRERDYNKTMNQKRSFNATNERYLEISYRDCYSELRLVQILHKYINVEICNEYKQAQHVGLPCSQSILEHVVKQAKFVCNHLRSDLPSEQWFTSRGPFLNRIKMDWEPAWGGFLKDIRRIGGWIILRKALKQENKQIQWSRESIITELTNLADTLNKSPCSIIASRNSSNLSKNRARRVKSAADRLFNGKLREAMLTANLDFLMGPVYTDRRKTHLCKCGKAYSAAASLCRHKKVCAAV